MGNEAVGHACWLVRFEEQNPAVWEEAAGGEHHSGAHAPDSEQEYACPSVWTVCVTQTAVWVP